MTGTDALPAHYRKAGQDQGADRPTPGLVATQSSDAEDIDVLSRVHQHKEWVRRTGKAKRK